MGSFAVVFFFAVTGLTLNHPQWFANQQHTSTMKGVMEARWTNTGSDDRVGKLEIVEFLRKAGIQGALDDFRIEPAECDLTFKGPGYSADVFIERATGRYEVTESRLGFAAIINDLHKGRDSGRAWKWFIDVSAVLLTFVSATGLVLIWFVHRHRVAGLLSLGAGCVLTYLLYAIFVP
jgi:hypothetical protein